MLYSTILFLIVAIIAGVLGIGGVALPAAGMAKTLFFIFLDLLIVSLVRHLSRRVGPVRVEVSQLLSSQMDHINKFQDGASCAQVKIWNADYGLSTDTRIAKRIITTDPA